MLSLCLPLILDREVATHSDTDDPFYLVVCKRHLPVMTYILPAESGPKQPRNLCRGPFYGFH